MIGEEKENLQQQSASSCQPNGGQSNDDQSNDGEPEDDQSNGGQSNDDQSNDGESDDGAGSNPTIKMLEDILDQDENNVGRDETIKQLIQENIDHTGSRQFYPATPYTIGQNARDDSVIAEAQGISSQLRRQLRQYLESSTWDEEFRTSNGRKLSSRALSSIPTGQTKVFTKRIDGVGIDTAVLFLIDRSGSMSNAIDTAAKAALAAALAIESNQGCSVQVAAFPGCKEDKVIEISKFGQKVADNSAIYRVIGTEGSTPLAPAMIYGLQELALRQEERKVMIVVTDGNPDCETSSERAYELAKKMGVDLIGIGINLDVDWLFKNSRKISSVDELPKCMFEVMKASMLTGNLHS
jgi:cobalamin biosynthesis protein CobT